MYVICLVNCRIKLDDEILHVGQMSNDNQYVTIVTQHGVLLLDNVSRRVVRSFYCSGRVASEPRFLGTHDHLLAAITEGLLVIELFDYIQDARCTSGVLLLAPC